MKKTHIVKLSGAPELAERAARWFARKWGIPEEAYRRSMAQALRAEAGVPQWYAVLAEDGSIIAGAGVIENDFHDRPDLSPNLCALYVEEPFRGRGIARALLDFARTEMARAGISRLYLVTDHTRFYERCGWEFLAMVHDTEGIPERMYTIACAPPQGTCAYAKAPHGDCKR